MKPQKTQNTQISATGALGLHLHPYNDHPRPACAATEERHHISIPAVAARVERGSHPRNQASQGCALTSPWLKSLVLPFVFFVSFCSISSAQPLQFTYQGRLTDSNGVPVSTSVTGIFRIVKGGTITNGGQEVYAQTNDVKPDVNGVFSVALGSINPIPLTAIADGTSSNRYIEAVINDQTNLPRQQVLSVPYAIQAIVGTPPGTVKMFAGPLNKIPEGWLICTGQPVSRVTYTNLYDAIGTAWGTGDGSTTFNVPDFRGRFPRGVTFSSPNDPDVNSRTVNGNGDRNEVGSVQGDAFQSHTHNVPSNGNQDYTRLGTYGGEDWNSPNSNYSAPPRTTTGPTGNSSSETRPKNAYVHFIIKY